MTDDSLREKLTYVKIKMCWKADILIYHSTCQINFIIKSCKDKAVIYETLDFTTLALTVTLKCLVVAPLKARFRKLWG
jgi:hypothetical protein